MPVNATPLMQQTLFNDNSGKRSSMNEYKNELYIKSRSSKTRNEETGSRRQERKALKETYEKPISGREWWRTHIRETPVPGTYESKDFLNEFLEQKPFSYSFKTVGRKKELESVRWKAGETLLPGAYDLPDTTSQLDKLPLTYSFKNTERKQIAGSKDKDCNVPPCHYPIEHYLAIQAEKTSSRHAIFKSNTSRFPTIYFKGTFNPSPGHYENIKTKSISISSSFMSKTPRFRTAHTRVPGPGSYEKTYQYPQPSTLAKMGRAHGLFFTSAFDL